MITRRAVLRTGAAFGLAGALAACGSTEVVNPTPLPDYAGQGGTTAMDGLWVGIGYSTWKAEVKNGVFTASGAGQGLSSWAGEMTGFIRKDHTIEGTARSSSGVNAVPVGGTWPRVEIHWSDGAPSVIRMTKQ